MTIAIGRALRLWLVARTVLAAMVLSLATTIFMPVDNPSLGPTPIILLSIVALAMASSFVVATIVQRGASPLVAAAMLLVLDVTEVTLAVGVTGGAGSVLTVLYGAIIVASATALGARAAFVAGALSLTSYGVVAIGMSWGYIPPPNDQPLTQYEMSARDLTFSIMSNLIAMTVVTLLSNELAGQLDRAGGALATSEEKRRRLAALYENVVQSIGSGLLTLRSDGVVTWVNPATEELLASSAERLVGSRIDAHFPSLVPAAIPEGDRTETRGRRTDGSEFPAGYSVARLEGPDVESESDVLLAFQDLTEIRRLERAARDAERLATLGRVAATLAHEIRNPLSSISGCVELVREGATLGEEDRNLLALVVKEAERLDELVDAMLDVARKREPRFVEFDLAVVSRDVATMASAGVGTNATVTQAASAPSVLDVVGDPGMGRQILWNLVKNAIQSSGANATVELAFGQEESRGFFIEVRDRGPGIDEADRERIFDAFHTSRTRGVGLGLALVRQLVEAHHGVIRVRARDEGPGTVFRVEIPPLQPTSTPSRDSILLGDET